MEQHPLFRKAALDKLASPERLDVLMQVTSPLGWLALLTMAIMVGAMVAWSIFGRMSETISGQGILVGGGQQEIAASGDGVLQDLNLTVNEAVREGQVVGTLTDVSAAGSSRSVIPASQILASASGRVIEVNKRIGDHLKSGDTIARIAPPDAQMEAIVFVDASAGTRIVASSEARISPSTVRREDYGFMIGSVQSVSDSPVTDERLNSLFSNQRMFQDLMSQGSKLEVRASVQADSRTASGFKWSSSIGPPYKVPSGTRVSVSVVVDQVRPISKVLPFIRKTFGTS